MPLPPLQLRAVTLLAMGKDSTSAAQAVGVSRMTLFRWKKNPAFQAALDKQSNAVTTEMLDAVQETASVVVAGALEAAQALRKIINDQQASDHERRLAACSMIKFAQRFWDMLGFSAPRAAPRADSEAELEEDEIETSSDATAEDSAAASNPPTATVRECEPGAPLEESRVIEQAECEEETPLIAARYHPRAAALIRPAKRNRRTPPPPPPS